MLLAFLLMWALGSHALAASLLLLVTGIAAVACIPAVAGISVGACVPLLPNIFTVNGCLVIVGSLVWLAFLLLSSSLLSVGVILAVDGVIAVACLPADLSSSVPNLVGVFTSQYTIVYCTLHSVQ